MAKQHSPQQARGGHFPRRILLLTGLLLARLAWADAEGDQLAQRVYDRAQGLDVSSGVSMTLTEKGRLPRQRKMFFYRYRRTSGETGILIRFTEPGDIRGTGLLTLDRADGESSQWIYLPALQRVQRIDAGRKGGRFVNSDYYYEDLRDRKFSRDSHRILGRETLEGASCMLLESVPVEAGDSVYAKRLIWVESDTLLPLRIDFFEKRQDQPAKRWLATRRERIQGYWTVMDSTLTDLENGHQTRLSVDKIAYDRRLPAHLFSSRTLEDEHAEAAFRP